MPSAVGEVLKAQKAKAAAVDEKRAQSQQRAGSLKKEIDVLMKTDPPDIAKLKAVMENEFARAAEIDALVKAAIKDGLPITPSPAKISFDANASPGASEWNAQVCAEAFKKYTWFDFKDLRKSGDSVDVPGLREQTRITDDVMWKLYQFRRRVVDNLITDLKSAFPETDLKFKSGGSEDIESDLDITVASPKSGDDVKVMTLFNNKIKGRFGRPPGRVFDTNLYARDYRAIEDTMTPGGVDPGAPKDEDIAQPTGAMVKMSNIDQDVATLMKQRRFLDEETFTAMWQALRDTMPDETEKARIQQRFEEGEAAFLLTAKEKVEAIIAKMEKSMAKFTPEQRKAYDAATLKFARVASVGDLRKTQRQLPDLLEFLEQEFPDQVMDATDEIYAQRMGELRARQDELRDKEQHSEQGPACDEIHPGKTHDEWQQELNALKARIKQAQFTNIVFANEAYVSEGAIAHIVAGSQASTPEKKAEVLAKITPAELLQSTNEQMADFFKDMRHMEHAEKAAQGTARRRATGEAFVHASKYLSRMLDAAAMLQEKYASQPDVLQQLSTPPFDLCQRAKVASPRELQTKVDEQLVRLRKSSTIPGDAKAEVAVAEVKALFGVDSIDWLRKLITGFCVDFNERVRKLEEFRQAQAVDRETEAQYFRPAKT